MQKIAIVNKLEIQEFYHYNDRIEDGYVYLNSRCNIVITQDDDIATYKLIEDIKDSLIKDNIIKPDLYPFSIIEDLSIGYYYIQEKMIPMRDIDFIMLFDIGSLYHPIIQRKLLPNLLKIYPNALFVVSTNSPLVIGSVKANLIHLSYNNENKLILNTFDTPYGYDVEHILKVWMGVKETRCDEVASLLKECGDFLHKKDMEKTKAKLEELASIIPDDSELVYLNSLLRFMGMEQKINK